MSSLASILIVGAGPTGLMMAAELARHGIQARIIDKKPEPIYESNATWLQTLTLEIFDHIDILQNFIAIGNACHAIKLYLEGNEIGQLSSDTIFSIHPYFLILSQSETERLLNQRLGELGNYVQRGIKLIDVQRHTNKVQVSLTHGDDTIEKAEYDYVIACDGVNSTVRQLCKITFPGEDLTEQFVVADAIIHASHMTKDAVHFYFDEGSVFVAFPMGNDQYRIQANLHLDHKRQLFTNSELIEMVQERAHGAFYVTSVKWISLFWVHGKVIPNMAYGPIYFAGDAAHVHSPAGGQGMNTGLQDAYNLAWKMALVIKGNANATLLDSYNNERKPVITSIVRETNHYTKMALFDSGFLSKLREFAQKIKSNEDSCKEIVSELTQLSIHYDKSPIIDYRPHESSPKPGEHAPNVRINTTTTLYDSFKNPVHNILLFSGKLIDQSLLDKFKFIQKEVARDYHHMIKVSVISKENLQDFNHFIYDSEGEVHRRYQVQVASILIIRPDNYIAYRSEEVDFSNIEAWLKLYLI